MRDTRIHTCMHVHGERILARACARLKFVVFLKRQLPRVSSFKTPLLLLLLLLSLERKIHGRGRRKEEERGNIYIYKRGRGRGDVINRRSGSLKRRRAGKRVRSVPLPGRLRERMAR